MPLLSASIDRVIIKFLTHFTPACTEQSHSAAPCFNYCAGSYYQLCAAYTPCELVKRLARDGGITHKKKRQLLTVAKFEC